MPLDRGCSRRSAQNNYRILYDEGKRNPQLSAIVLNVLKRSCGVKNKDRMTIDEIVAAKSAVESRWFPLEVLFEGLPSSPVVRGLRFNVPGGMRQVGTSPSAAAPSASRGLAGYNDPPIPMTKCKKCGTVYQEHLGECPRCKTEAVNLGGGMRMNPLVGSDVPPEARKQRTRPRGRREKKNA